MREILLLPGGGRTSRDWTRAMPFLQAAGLRTVAVDLPEMGTWSWPGALAAVAAAIEEHGMDRPAVAGHSLGGLVAALWATEHPECPLAVNLDGHTNPTGPYEGIDPVEGERIMRDFLTAEATDPAVAHLVAEMDVLDLFATYRAARCPLLVVSSTATDLEELLPPDVAEVFTAYRRGFARELAATAAATPLLTLADLPTGHYVHMESPEEVARLIAGAAKSL
ncbi:alpha/beta fold hydrolase [Nonomuraea sp. SYSU D8015]|uniref:alpha/beta fold hydrolase n=1 Tax=Nonomuraea sp. SYSU D8015 TaxID=2593644 RepID=UPI0016614184|nr:alpha/beta hydrolase [Nonomuraea sp. SYSU D8015]